MPRSQFPGVAVVTGAASGIGRQIAKSFAAEGCSQIALLDRDEDGLSETARLCKAQSTNIQTFVIPFDVRMESEVEASMDLIVEEWGRIDYAVNCAGTFRGLSASPELDVSEFDRINNVNYRGTWLCSRAEISRMMNQKPLPTHDGRPGSRGAIVNVAGNVGMVRMGGVACDASKAAVISMTKAEAIDNSKHNIRVNCVCPAIIDTPTTKESTEIDAIVNVAPLGRKGTVQEVADAVLFLCSSKASFIQGVTLPVDGGCILH